MGNIMIKPTSKLYYENPFLKKCEATIEAIRSGILILDKTVAFPEGGGQEGDRGEIILPNGKSIQFCDTQKELGRTIFLRDFPTINVETKILHHIADEDVQHLADLKLGEKVNVIINVDRRERLTISHSASHILYMAINRVRPDAVDNIIGCHIKEDSARFDFAIPDRFTADEIESIQKISNEIIEGNFPIELYQHKEEPEAWFWKCNDVIIPCGGTHLSSTGRVVDISVGRKSLGKGKERIKCTFPNAIIDVSQYST